jgi:hypothetical protein
MCRVTPKHGGGARADGNRAGRCGVDGQTASCLSRRPAWPKFQWAFAAHGTTSNRYACNGTRAKGRTSHPDVGGRAVSYHLMVATP